MVTASIVIDASSLLRTLDGIEARLANDKPLLDAAGARMQESIGQRFMTQGNGEWASVMPSTLKKLQRWTWGKAKTKKKREEVKASGMVKGTILRRTGYLMRSFGRPNNLTPIAGENGEVYYPEDHAIVIQSNVKFAGFHQTGTSKMVARPIIVASEEDKRVIKNYAAAWYLEGDIQKEGVGI